MSRIVGRFFIICAFLSGVLLLGFRFALDQRDVQTDFYRRAQESNLDLSAPQSPPLDALKIRPCAHGSCLFIEGSGREFVFGAGANSAQGLFSIGALSSNLDGVLLGDLSRGGIEGLSGVRDRTLEAGRRDPLPVYGPSGVERVVDGVNAMLETSDAERAVRYSEGLLPFSAAPVIAADMQGLEDGAIIFDSGVLTIRIVNVVSEPAGGDGLIYRFDQGDNALIVSGCRARAEDIRAALELDPQPKHFGLVLPAASEEMLEIQREEFVAAGYKRESRFVGARADECLTLGAYRAILTDIAPDAAMAWPLYPAAVTQLDKRFWNKHAAMAVDSSSLVIGDIGVALIIGENWTSN